MSKEKRQRWYDKSPILREIFLLFGILNGNEFDSFSRLMYQSVLDYKKNKQDSSSLRNIGSEKIQNYYNSYKRRRWYDTKPLLRNSMLFVGIMEPMDINKTINYFMFEIKQKGYEETYKQKRNELYKDLSSD